MAKPDINATFDEEKNPYARQRMAVMTDEQQKLAEKLQDWYCDAYWDKDNRGVFEKMETCDLYWEGEANPPESDTDPASNTNVVNSTIEGQVAYLVEQNIAIEAKARKPSSLAFRNKAVNLMEWCKDQNKMVRKMDVHERRRKKFGVGVFRVLFEPDMLDGLGLPWIEPVNPAYVFTDPVVTDIYKVQDGRFLIESINRSIDSAKEEFGEERGCAIEPGYVPMEYSDLFDEFERGTEGEIASDHYLHWLVWTHAWVDEDFGLDAKPEEADEASELVEDEGEPAEDDESSDEDAEPAEMLGDDEDADEAYAGDAEGDTPKEKGLKKILRLIEMSSCGVILRDTLEDGVLICEDDIRYPYFFTPDMYREGTVWAKSTAELLIPQQDLIDDLDDQIRINARLTGNPQREVNINTGVDPDKMSNEGGLIYPVNENNGIKFLQPPEIPQYIPQRRNQAFQERTIVSRWSDQMNGIKQEGVDTATESLGLQQGGTQSISHDKRLLGETLAELFEYCLILMMENYTETEIFSITDMGVESFMSLNPSSLKNIPMLMAATPSYQQTFAREYPEAQNVPEWMPHPEGLTEKIALNIVVTVGAGLPSNKAFIYQMIKDDPDITPPERRKFKREYLGLPISETPELPPQVPAQIIPQMAGGLQATGGIPPGLPPGAGNPNVAGLTPAGAPAAPAPGGVV